MTLNNILAFSGLINAVIFFLVGLITIVYNYRKKSTWIFAGFIGSFCLWSLSYYYWLSSINSDQALFWIHAVNIFSAFIPSTFYHWQVTVLCNVKSRFNNLFVFVGYIVSIFFALAAFAPFYVTGLRDIAGFTNWPIAGWLYIFFVIFYILYYFLGLKESVRASFAKEDSVTRSIGRLVLVGVSFGLIAGATNFPLWFGLEVWPFGNYLIILFIFCVSYAMSRFNLMDLESAVSTLFVVVILTISIIEIFLSESFLEVGLRTIFLLIVAFFSFLLMQSFNREIMQRTKLEKLTKKLEQANNDLKKLDKAKSEFISIASHQLRTPLTAIKGYLSLIQEGTYGSVSDEVGGAVKKIYSANARIINLVEDLLNISRIESGRMQYQFQEVNMSKVVSDLRDTFINRTNDEGIDFSISLPEEAMMVKADATKISEVVSNIIDNSIKYTEKGFVNVDVRRVGGMVTIIISDSGIGIPDHVMPQLFKKFSRGKDPSRLHVDGTGLGLYVCKNILEAHHGRITVTSPGAGKGSTFTIEIPYLEVG